MMLERQNKELKAKLEEVENSNRAKAKAAIGKCLTGDISHIIFTEMNYLAGDLLRYILGENRGKACK